MEANTIYFTRIYGLLFTISSAIFLLAPTLKRRIVLYFKQTEPRIIAALSAMMLGGMTVYFLQHERLATTLLVTILGWMALVKGMIIILVPTTMKIAERIVRSKWFSIYLILFLLFGLYLLIWSVR